MSEPVRSVISNIPGEESNKIQFDEAVVVTVSVYVDKQPVRMQYIIDGRTFQIKQSREIHSVTGEVTRRFIPGATSIVMSGDVLETEVLPCKS